MEHLSLEIFDLTGTGSKYAMLPEDATITITDTSEIFSSGDVWSHSFTLNVAANAHIFGSSGELHGSRLHEQINKRRARLWVEGLPLYLGHLKLDDEVDVDEDGNVEVTLESGQKTFEEQIDGINAREVSVGDTIIGVALNRKRVIHTTGPTYDFTLDGLVPYSVNDEKLEEAVYNTFKYTAPQGVEIKSPYAQRWPKLVMSHGTVYEGPARREIDYTNIQMPYDAGHPFCNINICYQLKVMNKDNEEVAARGYTLRYARNKPTVDGGDNQTRFNNSPNFYLLHFIDRLFKDLKIHVEENQCLDVEDLRRVFMLNYGCHYEEIENDNDYFNSDDHYIPQDKTERYGQYRMKIVSQDGEEGQKFYPIENWQSGGMPIVHPEDNCIGKILLRDVNVEIEGENVLTIGSIEGKVTGAQSKYDNETKDFECFIDTDSGESLTGRYPAYLAYATGDNYPNVEIKEIIDAMKSMFGVRLIFNDNYSTVRIVLLRNIFNSKDVQEISCDIIKPDIKQENCIRGFRMTYGAGTDNTNFYYKGFNDLFRRSATTWKDTTDRHDYSQWKLDADYNEIKQSVSAMNRTCYVTPITGNAFIIKVDEDEDVLFPSLFEAAGFMDAEDGDCTGESETIEEVQASASPLIMNEIGNTYASLFTGDMKAPTPENYEQAPKIATFARLTRQSIDVTLPIYHIVRTLMGRLPSDVVIGHITGKLDVYMSEGFQIRMEDNYSISNVGTPFDDFDPGLCFGIMRSSGEDAYVRYFADPDDKEGNDTWEVEPGSSAISHSDTCDNYGKEWDYTGSIVVTPAEAPSKLAELFPNSDAPFYNSTLGYITETTWFYVNDSEGKRRVVLVASAYSIAGKTVTSSGDLRSWTGLTLEELLQVSSGGRHMVIEVDSSQERGNTLVQLCKLAYGGGTETMRIDNGVGSRYGRFSLKLRAEKLNPEFNPKEAESSYNRRYLPITSENLRRRGLADQFYKEYSHWVRNARIAKRQVHMELATLLSIDKTVRVTVGDVTGFIKKMQFEVSNKTGLGLVTMEILYI